MDTPVSRAARAPEARAIMPSALLKLTTAVPAPNSAPGPQEVADFIAEAQCVQYYTCQQKPNACNIIPVGSIQAGQGSIRIGQGGYIAAVLPGGVVCRTTIERRMARKSSIPEALALSRRQLPISWPAFSDFLYCSRKSRMYFNKARSAHAAGPQAPLSVDML